MNYIITLVVYGAILLLLLTIIAVFSSYKDK